MIIGGYKIHSISWGNFMLDGGSMFGVVPKKIWEKKIPADKDNMIKMEARGLILQGHDRNILIDLGIGTKEDDLFYKRYKAENIKSTHEVLNGLNLCEDDITDVFITHLHFDHCGGSTIIENSDPVPAFKNAKYYIQKGQWDSALSGEARDHPSFFKHNFLPLQENNNLFLIDGERENILPNISLKISNGHTKAQQHPLIHDENKTLFYCGDIFPTSAHITPRWLMAYDNQPETAMKEKESFLKAAVREEWIMFFEHDPVVEACRVKNQDGKFIISEIIEI